MGGVLSSFGVLYSRSKCNVQLTACRVNLQDCSKRSWTYEKLYTTHESSNLIHVFLMNMNYNSTAKILRS